MNRIFLVGNVVNEIQFFLTKNDKPIAKTSIIVNQNPNNNFFMQIVAFDRNAKFMQSFLHKGDFVIIDGKLTQNKYKNKEGQEIINWSVTVDNIISRPKYFKPQKEVLNVDDVVSDENTTLNENENFNWETEILEEQ